MGFRITWVSTIGALLTMIACSLFRADAQTPVPPGLDTHDLLPVESTGAGQSPVKLSRSGKSVISAPGTIGIAAIPGAHSYALFSGAEFNMLYNNEAWLTSQLDRMGGTYVLEGLKLQGFEPVPPLESIVSTPHTTERNHRMAFFDEDQTKPAGTTTGAPPVPPADEQMASKSVAATADDTPSENKTDDSSGAMKPVVHRDGRLILNIAVKYSGWPQRDAGADESDKKENDVHNNVDDDDGKKKAATPTVDIPPSIPSDLP